MLNRYPISAPLRSALEALFPDFTVAEGLLGDDLRDKGLNPERAVDSASAKALELKNVLEGYLCQMAKELEELGDEEAPRLQSEARGLLVALRELALRFPEVVLLDQGRSH